MAEQHPLKPFYSVLVLAFACSALVAGAAVGLRPLQQANRQLDQKKNILRAAGLYDQQQKVDQLFAAIETRVVDLATGRFVSEDVIDPRTYNQLKAALSDDLGRPVDKEADLARLSRQEKYSLVYLVKKDDRYDELVLPVRGKGLWSTMYAYVAVDADLNTIRGISFYEHGETPGLGGEVENPKWQAGWQGKQLYSTGDSVQFRLTKAGTAPSGDAARFEVDGLSGATMTSNGVTGLMRFWFGDHGFKPFFDQLRQKGGLNG
jgi:Na+-transporting NADH:ubiquinone oxidoreductase subunit C